jgi:hypothetical protein
MPFAGQPLERSIRQGLRTSTLQLPKICPNRFSADSSFRSGPLARRAPARPVGTNCGDRRPRPSVCSVDPMTIETARQQIDAVRHIT